MRPLSEATARLAGRSFERKYIALGRIVNNWREIVGSNLADKAQPARILYRKRKNSKTADATLEIATSSSDATLLHYQKDLILERINQVFGEQWISALRFVHFPTNNSYKKYKNPSAPLTDDEKKTLSDMVFEVKDVAMRDRLYHLGSAILLDQKK